ncbi:phage major capsid protein [Paracraurococcus lichenis]|uniref:Phage major capsid protein n=1 Tax=Paracraurococcus lichenis TaxID=3064888 RepID=A0ABT9E772_9PROT|nr:phage major capsid protein [Paracraurococcus sp. LOR1-02]MDO9711974.1 phage major capsid protein [Paracraurococcus sp. LOR1-02]
MSKRLSELQRKHANKVAELKALIAKSDEDTVSDEDKAAFEALKGELNTLKESIALLNEVRALEADAAAPVGKSDEDEDDKEEKQAPQFVRRAYATAAAPATNVEKGLRAARYLIGAHAAKSIGPRAAANMIHTTFNDDVTAKALSQSGGASVGGVLIPTSFSNDLIELLRARTAVRASNPMSLSLDTGNVTIPRLSGGSSATWQGEVADITASQQSFDTVTLSAKKLATVVPVSNDLLRRTPVGLDAVIRDDLVESLARKEDLGFLRGDGTSGSPVGIRNFAGLTTTVAPGVTLANVVTFLRKMVLSLENANSRMIRPVWVMHPQVKAFISTLRDGVGGFFQFKDELDAGKLYGFPVLTTTQLPTNLTTAGGTAGTEIFLYDAADLILAQTLNIQVDVSSEASFYNGTGYESAFSKDMTLFRVITEVDVNNRHIGSFIVGLADSWTV